MHSQAATDRRPVSLKPHVGTLRHVGRLSARAATREAVGSNNIKGVQYETSFASSKES
jgi:hypothetical protein